MENTTHTGIPQYGLIHPDKYFLRYAELLAEKKQSKTAWIQVEKELWKETNGFRRFLSHRSLVVAYCKHHKGIGTKNVSLTYSNIQFFS